MKKLTLLPILALTPLVLSFLLTSPSLHAETSSSDYTAPKKLQRGLHNGVTGWMEAPITVQKFNRERNWFEAWTTGVTRGVGLAIARTGAGIYEVATFPFAAPKKFEPIMMPERVEG